MSARIRIETPRGRNVEVGYSPMGFWEAATYDQHERGATIVARGIGRTRDEAIADMGRDRARCNDCGACDWESNGERPWSTHYAVICVVCGSLAG